MKNKESKVTFRVDFLREGATAANLPVAEHMLPCDKLNFQCIYRYFRQIFHQWCNNSHSLVNFCTGIILDNVCMNVIFGTFLPFLISKLLFKMFIVFFFILCTPKEYVNL